MLQNCHLLVFTVEKRSKLCCLGWLLENWLTKLHKWWLCNKILLLHYSLIKIFKQFFVVPFVSIFTIISQIFNLQNHEMVKSLFAIFEIHTLYTEVWTCPNRLVSSAKWWTLQNFIVWLKSFICNTIRRGPKTDPWGIPQFIAARPDSYPFIDTY